MTGEIVIKMGAPPVVFMDGEEVGCRINITFHKAGDLNVKSIQILNLPEPEEGK